MDARVSLILLCLFLRTFRLTSSLKRSEHEKFLLISAEYLPLDALHQPTARLTTFQKLIKEGCLVPDVPISNFTSSADIHSIMLSGGLHRNEAGDGSRESQCNHLIHSKISPYFEPLWLTNQRHGLKSASFFWPDNYVIVNDSRPSVIGEANPAPRGAYFNIDQIHRTVLDPRFTFVSIVITPPHHLNEPDFFFNYVEYTEAFLSSLLSLIENSPDLNASVSVLIIGGTAAINTQLTDEVVPIRQFLEPGPLSAFDAYFSLGRVLEFWTTPDEENEALLSVIEKESDDFFSCSTAKFGKRSNLNTSMLPPYYIVAKPGKILQVADSKPPHPTNQSYTPQLSPFALLWGNAFVSSASSDVCAAAAGGKGQSKASLRLVDVYPMVCWLLHLSRPWIHWGHLSRVVPFLRQPPLPSQVEEFEALSEVWSASPHPPAATNTWLIGGIICLLVVAFSLTLVTCAIKMNWRYQRVLRLSGGADPANVRYHKRRITRPWRPSSSTPSSTHNQRLLGDAGGRQGDGETEEDDDEEEEVLMDNSTAGRGRRQGERGEAFLKMLHSPPESRGSRTFPDPSHA